MISILNEKLILFTKKCKLSQFWRQNCDLNKNAVTYQVEDWGYSEIAPINWEGLLRFFGVELHFL
jgi:hypothetical protein